MKKKLLLLVPVAFAGLLAGCPPPPSPPESLTVDGPTTLQVSAQGQYTATVAPPDAAQNVNWSLSCGSSSCGTLSSSAVNPVVYTAPATVPTGGTVTLTATTVASPTKMGSITITITPKPVLTVQITSPSPAPASVVVNSQTQFTATVTNDPNTAGVMWTVTGNCSGTACGTFSATFGLALQFALGSGANTKQAFEARFIAFDNLTIPTIQGSGVMKLRPPVANFSNSSINSDFAFGTVGASTFLKAGVPTPNRFGLVGRFTAADGLFSNGFFDFNAGLGSLIQNRPFTGVYTIASSGRGTGSFLAGGLTVNFAFYVVNAADPSCSSFCAGQIVLIGTDPRGTFNLFSGLAHQQAGLPFTLSSFNATNTFFTTRLQGGGGVLPGVEIGTFTFGGNGNLTISDDDNDGGSVSCNIAGVSGCGNSIAATYSLAAPIGLQTSGPLGRISTSSNVQYVFYMVDHSRGFIMNLSGTVDTGFFEEQLGGPFSSSSLIDAGLAFGEETPATPKVDNVSGTATFAVVFVGDAGSPSPQPGTLVIGDVDFAAIGSLVGLDLPPTVVPVASVAPNGRVTFVSGGRVGWIIQVPPGDFRFVLIPIDNGLNPSVRILEFN